MITRINDFQAADGRNEELYIFLNSLAEYITTSERCISYEVLHSVPASSDFVVIERWVDIESHKKSIEHFPKEGMEKAMPLFGALPKGRYYSS